ncbi:MAG TPA: ClbS/DfsB family four-helix bundle protein [Chloroflexia bacterium]|nr:ClbS/DfsB family four-helix bundle protein [Chloroflexia bacterium]
MEEDCDYKQQAIGHVREELGRWEQLLAEVGTARMLQPGAMGAWTFKDLVAHLNGWWYYELDTLEALLAGQPPRSPWPEEWPVERKNQWFYSANKNRPLQDVLAESRAFFGRVEVLLARLPEQRLRGTVAIPWLNGRPLGTGFLDGCLEHLYGEHWPELRAWIGQLRADR